mmetsp:Transcript_62354/g.141028  ORF Transcript_62354/g.141028 Transcript_62354/m.141028 type:complete len:165 (+) Transcript_62354:539-1033(+)
MPPPWGRKTSAAPSMQCRAPLLKAGVPGNAFPSSKMSPAPAMPGAMPPAATNHSFSMKMPAAFPAAQFGAKEGAAHAGNRGNFYGRQRGGEARPTRTALKLGIAREERGTTAGADERPGSLLALEGRREGPLRPALPEHFILRWAEERPPLRGRPLHLVARGSI